MWFYATVTRSQTTETPTGEVCTGVLDRAFITKGGMLFLEFQRVGRSMPTLSEAGLIPHSCPTAFLRPPFGFFFPLELVASFVCVCLFFAYLCCWMGAVIVTQRSFMMSQPVRPVSWQRWCALISCRISSTMAQHFLSFLVLGKKWTQTAKQTHNYSQQLNIW